VNDLLLLAVFGLVYIICYLLGLFLNRKKENLDQEVREDAIRHESKEVISSYTLTELIRRANKRWADRKTNTKR
jgi:hypothetical protein